VAAGYQVALADINNTAGRVVVEVREAFSHVITFKTWLDAIPDATLTSAPISMAQADVNVLRSAFNDLKQLNDIRTGLATLATSKDFTTFAKQLTGVV
jgi:hypothetical protein